MAHDPLHTLGEIDPDMIKHLKETREFILKDGALSRKIKLLIAMAFDAAYGAENGVRSLAAEAVKEGATAQEISEALRVAYYLSGAGTLYTGSTGLKDLFDK